MTETLDLIVIGAGMAGINAAKKCSQAGWSVAIVDELPYGGTCALRGCDPKKMLTRLVAADRCHGAGDSTARWTQDGDLVAGIGVDGKCLPVQCPALWPGPLPLHRALPAGDDAPCAGLWHGAGAARRGRLALARHCDGWRHYGDLGAE